MKESDNQEVSKSKLKHIAIAIVFIGGISIVTSFITVKTLASASSALTPTSTTSPATQPPPTLYVLPSVTLDPSQTQESEFKESLRENNGIEIGTNLLQNSGFENGLSGWTYTDSPEGITIFETDGINGKAFCSRRPIFARQATPFYQEQVAFAQKISLDPTQSYFFSAWIKLNQAQHIRVYAMFYNGKSEAAIQYLGDFGYKQPETSSGWFFIYSPSTPSPISHTPNYVEIQFVHEKVDVNFDAPPTFSTICIDDVYFGQRVK
jgi:hypothetical protein